MAQTSELMAAGIPALPASMLGQDIATALSAAGTTQATGTAITAELNFFTTVGSGAGATLPNASGAAIAAVINGGANPLTIYPAVGEILNNLAANVGVVIAPNKAAIFVPAGTRWGAIIGA